MLSGKSLAHSLRSQYIMVLSVGGIGTNSQNYRILFGMRRWCNLSSRCWLNAAELLMRENAVKFPHLLKFRRNRNISIVCGLILVVGLLLPQELIIPVKGAAPRDWNPNSWWYEPWGESGVHKGIDIFAPKKTPVLAPISGVVIYRGEMRL